LIYMQGTRHEDRTVNRPMAKHRARPDLDLTIAIIEMRLIELPDNSIRRQTLEGMIERVQS
jgi:hypothetical protein